MVKAQVINGEGELGQAECWNKRTLYHVSPRERDPDYPAEPWSFIMLGCWVGDENLSVAVVIQCRVQDCHSSEVKPKHLHGAGGGQPPFIDAFIKTWWHAIWCMYGLYPR